MYLTVLCLQGSDINTQFFKSVVFKLLISDPFPFLRVTEQPKELLWIMPVVIVL